MNKSLSESLTRNGRVSFASACIKHSLEVTLDRFRRCLNMVWTLALRCTWADKGGRRARWAILPRIIGRFFRQRAESSLVVAASALLYACHHYKAPTSSQERARDMLTYMEAVIDACFPHIFDLRFPSFSLLLQRYWYSNFTRLSRLFYFILPVAFGTGGLLRCGYPYALWLLLCFRIVLLVGRRRRYYWD